MGDLMHTLHRDCDSEGARMAQAADEAQARENFRQLLPAANVLYYQLMAMTAERDAAVKRAGELQRELDMLRAALGVMQ